MPRLITQYRVFMGSPGGLQEERKRFRSSLEKFSRNLGSDRNVTFEPVGWEDTIGGVGRPQELINDDLKQCDYAAFVLHDRWGSSTGSGYTSGTEEEWNIAEGLYKENKIRNIALFFKAVDPGKLLDPGDQLKQVLRFRDRIEKEKRYLFNSYETLDDFIDAVDGHLGRWLKEHERTIKGPSNLLEAKATNTGVRVESPSFSYWITETYRPIGENFEEMTIRRFFAGKAIETAKTDIEWARAKERIGIIEFSMGRIAEAIGEFNEIINRFSSSLEPDRRLWLARISHRSGRSLGSGR